MNSMMHIAIVMLFVCSLYEGTTGEPKFLLSSNSATWDGAVTSCRSARGMLAVMDSPEGRQIFDRDIDLDPGQKVWMGRFIGYTQIVAIGGCYSNVSLGNRKTVVREDNSLVTCLAQCPESAYIAMQDKHCYCLDGLSPQASVGPGIYCKSSCPGESVSSPVSYISHCGNARYNAVSLYKIVRPEEISIDLNIPNQGECVAYNVRTRQWQTEDCNTQHLLACDKRPCFPNLQQCLLTSVTSSSWFDGREKCEGSGGYLATVDIATTNKFDQTVVNGNNPVYWTGLHRKEIVKWINENTTSIYPSDRCLALTKSPDGTLDWTTDWCTRQYQYVCVQDVLTPPPATSPPQTTTNSQASPTAFTTTMQSPGSSSESEVLPTVNPAALPVMVTSSARTLDHYNAVNVLLFVYTTVVWFL